MDIYTATQAFGAFAQPTRLKVFRLLIEHEPDGLPAGEIAREMDTPHNTMSSHLSILARAELVTSRREGRSVIYRINTERLEALLTYLLRDCCRGNPETCASLLASVLPASDTVDA